MRVYIATSLERVQEQRALAARLRRLGHEITYDWSVHGSVQHLGPDRIREVAAAEVAGVVAADVVIVLLPGGRGTHVELGIALGLRAHGNRPRILVVGDQHDSEEARMLVAGRECVFYSHPWVTRVATIEEALESGGPDMASNPEYVQVEIDGWQIPGRSLCSCMHDEAGFIRGYQRHTDRPATGYARRDCSTCGGAGRRP